MRSAACTVLFVLALGVFSGGAAAAGPLDPVTSSLTGDVQNQAGSVVNDPVGTATGTVSEATGAVSGAVDNVGGAADGATGGATGPVSGAVGGATGSATDSVDSVAGSVSGTAGSSGSGDGFVGSGTTSTASSSSGSGSAAHGGSTARTGDASRRGSNGGSPDTAFNRLPRRYEALLERIAAGQHVRANIARLRALLASASPQVRARILRLIGVEIRRLEKGGVTPHERAMLERLRRLRSALAPNPSPQAVGQSSLPPAAPSSVAAGAGQVRQVGTNAAFGGSERPAKSQDTGGGGGRISLPSVPGPPYLLLLLLGTLACGLLLACAAGRRVLPAHVRAVIATHGGAQLSAVAATVGLILAVAVGFMIQAFLP